jgi:hypothetical protein
MLKTGVLGAAVQLGVTGVALPEDPPPPEVPPEVLEGIAECEKVTSLLEESYANQICIVEEVANALELPSAPPKLIVQDIVPPPKLE